MTRFICFILFGALFVSTLATWLSPRLVSWYASPPVAIGVTCDPAMKWAMNKLIVGQSIGLAVGACLGFAFYFWFKGSKKVTKESVEMKRQ
ncbi:MAG: hypothetical protein K1X29_06905 [Bdellovibrionales bacterium]|nr:hypothetical protein [Bdellovibrionales bacterium]